MKEFEQIFKSPKAREMGKKLKGIIETQLNDNEGTISGGAKVKLVLYSRNGANNVLCGIQEGSNESCMLYIHYVDGMNRPGLKFSGKGKHAKRIKFNYSEEIVEDDIRCLLSQADKNAPF